MSAAKRRKYENCTICGDQVIHAPATNTASKLGDPEVLERIKEFNGGDIDETKLPMFVVCNSCRDQVDVAYNCFKKCQALITLQQPVSPKEFKDVETQTKSPAVIIIVNQIMEKVAEHHFQYIFSKYGKIQNLYFKTDSCGIEKFARIRFSSEDETLKVMEAAQNKKLKYWDKGNSLVVTRVSEDISPIDVLPNACLSEIFLRIDNFEDKVQIGKVCKRWKEVLSYSWSNITVFSDYSEFREVRTIKGLTSILKGCGRFLKSLRLVIHSNPISRMKLIAEHCKNIENLQLELSCLQGTKTYHHEMIPMFQQCSKLRRFFLENLDDEFDYSHLQHLPEEMLEIHLSSEDIETIPWVDLSKFQNLEALLLGNFDIQKDSLRGFENLVNLQYVSFSGSCVHQSLIKNLLNFRKLKHLAIPNCGVDDVILAQIIRRNLDLEHLDISDNSNITDLSFQYVARLTKLKTLWMKHLSQVTGTALTALHTLQCLDVEGCSSIADWTLIMVIDKSPNLRIVYATGPATCRLLINAEESIKLRCGNKNLEIIVDTNLAEKWSDSRRDSYGERTRLNVCTFSRDLDEWTGWHGDADVL